MRFNSKCLFALCLMGVMCVMLPFYWSRCNETQDSNFYREKHNFESLRSYLPVMPEEEEEAPYDDNEVPLPRKRRPEVLPYHEITCSINEDEEVPCRREDNEVYIPFTFLQKYFEIYGDINSNEDGHDVFEWRHSYSKVFRPKSKYDTRGVFMSFDHYNVEVRDRVKCVSAVEGVPVSTQWGAQGYYYPIQIAQYGLSHYSKSLVESEPTVTAYLDGSKIMSSVWNVPDSHSSVKSVVDPEKNDRVVEFQTSESFREPGIVYTIDEDQHFTLTFDLKFVKNGSVTVVVQTKLSDKPIQVTYTCSRYLISRVKDHIYYGLGEEKCLSWRRITRDMVIDVQKGYGKTKKGKKNRKKTLVKIISLDLRGHGWIDNVTIASTNHLQQFYDAADWLVKAQDSKGGWPIMVKRNVIKGVMELDPGWYSAMAQGQAMSILVRAYLKSNNKKYLTAALLGTKPFHVLSEQHGVKAMFMDRYPWYEEYPVTPSLFVLNGFIYSLMGLYDLQNVAPSGDRDDAQKLFQDGMTSLKAMLPLYDTGSGTIYDLRHVTLGIEPNLARWDYHSVHITQMLVLATIDENPIFQTTAERWISYMHGKRASHN